MLKVLVYSGIALVATAEILHPINDDMVNDIKKKTDKWQPHEAEDNPLKDYSHA